MDNYFTIGLALLHTHIHTYTHTHKFDLVLWVLFIAQELYYIE